MQRIYGYPTSPEADTFQDRPKTYERQSTGVRERRRGTGNGRYILVQICQTKVNEKPALRVSRKAPEPNKKHEINKQTQKRWNAILNIAATRVNGTSCKSNTKGPSTRATHGVFLEPKPRRLLLTQMNNADIPGVNGYARNRLVIRSPQNDEKRSNHLSVRGIRQSRRSCCTWKR